MPLFQRSIVTAAKPLSLVPDCNSCGLYKSCKTPKMKTSGKGRKKILVVGEAPGVDEDKFGRQFVGDTGRLLRSVLEENDIIPERDCWFENALACHPANNRLPNERPVDYCRPRILRVIEELNPKVVILLGGRAVKSIIGHYWKEDTGGIGRWAGFRVPLRQPNLWLAPTYHPSYIECERKSPNFPVLWQAFTSHIRQAIRAGRRRPWGVVPDYKKDVQVITSPDLAADCIRGFIANKEPISFDYETDRLKPDCSDARIVCCAVSDGRTTIAYPWHGEAVVATAGLLKSSIKKIGYNLKFEDRWTRAKLGFPVRNWRHDGMLVAHGLDNRQSITGLKFQAFVRLGQEDYASAMKPYLESVEPGGNSPNRIRQVPLSDLLLYCGLDALLEHLVWKSQQKELSHES